MIIERPKKERIEERDGVRFDGGETRERRKGRGSNSSSGERRIKMRGCMGVGG